jgi:hypothetical protein
MTDISLKATKIKRKLRLGIFVRKKLTKNPKSKDAVISDLFPIRNDKNWSTEFELLNVPGLILGDNNQSKPSISIFHFFDHNGILLGVRNIVMQDRGRMTIKIKDFLTNDLVDAKTFAVFHSSIDENLEFKGSYLAERGYTGYEYNNLGVKGYVHGNLDAVALVNGKVKPLGNSGILQRYYTVQHCLRGPAKYDFIFTNPTSKKVRIKPYIALNPNKWEMQKNFEISPLGLNVFYLEIEDGQKCYVKFRSGLYLARPVVFRVSNDSMDVFHG